MMRPVEEEEAEDEEDEEEMDGKTRVDQIGLPAFWRTVHVGG